MWLGTVTLSEPELEPITLEEARLQCRDDTIVDGQLAGYIAAARGWIEGDCEIRLIDQLVVMRATCWEDLDRLPIAPVTAIEAITYSSDGLDVPLVGFVPLLFGSYPGVGLRAGLSQPVRDRDTPIVVTATVGFGPDAASVPPIIRLAAKMLVSAINDNRGSIPDTAIASGRTLLRPYSRLAF